MAIVTMHWGICNPVHIPFHCSESSLYLLTNTELWCTHIEEEMKFGKLHGGMVGAPYVCAPKLLYLPARKLPRTLTHKELLSADTM